MCSLYYVYLSRVVRKPDICICENKDADQLRGNREADQRLCFRYLIVQSVRLNMTEKLFTGTLNHNQNKKIVQSFYFLNPKFQASSHLLLLYSLVCIGPGRKHRRPVFSERGSFVIWVVSDFGFEGGTVVLSASVPSHCLHFACHLDIFHLII